MGKGEGEPALLACIVQLLRTSRNDAVTSKVGFFFTSGLAACLGLSLPSCRRSPPKAEPASIASPVTQRSAGPSPTWAEPIELALGPAYAGPWRMNESEFRYVDDPSVALAADGSAAVAWVDNERKDVLLQVLEPNGRPRLASASNVSRTPAVFSWLPRIVVDTEGRLFALWQEIVFSGGSHGGEIFFARSEDGGNSFTPPSNLSRSVGGDGKGRLTKEHWDNGSLDLIRGAEQALFAAWTEYDGALWFNRSTDGGRSFSDPLRVAGTAGQPARGPALAARGELVYLAWTVGEDAAADIRLAISRDRGRTFDAPRVVTETAGRGDAPQIAIDDANVLHLVHAESEVDRAGVSRVRYLRLKPTSPGFEQPRTISQQQGASFPSLSLGPPAHVYVVWQHHPVEEEPARGLSFVASRDGGQTFSAPSLLEGTSDPALGANGSRQGKLMRLLAANHSGALAVVSSNFREGERSRIRLLRGQL